MHRLVAASLGFVWACGPTRTRDEAASSADPPRTVLPAASFAEVTPPPPAPSSAPSAAAEAPPLTFAALEARFPPAEPWASGPGVACGEKRCGPGEVCCEGTVPKQCVARARASECMAGGNVVAACDESSDCPGAERCCEGHTDDGILAECASPARCARTWDRPGGFGLPATELCARGGRCKDPAYTCIAVDDTSVSGGACVSKRARVRCGDAGECPSARPWCLWDAERKSGTCIPRGPWRREPRVLECDTADDCPGHECCGNGQSGTFCSTTECTPELAYAPMVCRTLEDCERQATLVATCDPDESLPSGMGMCSWSEKKAP